MSGEAQTTATTSTTSVTMPKASSSPQTKSESIEESMDNGFTRTHETQDLDFDRSTFGGSFMVSFLVRCALSASVMRVPMRTSRCALVCTEKI